MALYRERRRLIPARSKIPVSEYGLLLLLALLWGSSYLLIKVAVTEISPVTLMAARVTGAALFLLLVMRGRKARFPRRAVTWRRLLVQAFLNSIGAWTLLAWGQQFVDAGLASVLNSTSPIFVFVFTILVTRHEAIPARKIVGALLGISGVVLIVGLEGLSGLGSQVAGQLACLAGAALYAGAAIYGKHFGSLGALTTATATMVLASIVLVPAALVVEQPWLLNPSLKAIAATLVLSIFCTGIALLIYFRLIQTLGSMGVASQAYLRAGVGVVLGMVLLGEILTLSVSVGLAAAIAGVVLINWPTTRAL